MKLRTEAGHFWITFENGYTLSCFNGYGSHTENNFAIDKWKKIYMNDNPNFYDNWWESKLIEIAILNKEGKLITQDIIDSDGSVKTIDINELVDIINKVNNLKS